MGEICDWVVWSFAKADFVKDVRCRLQQLFAVIFFHQREEPDDAQGTEHEGEEGMSSASREIKECRWFSHLFVMFAALYSQKEK